MTEIQEPFYVSEDELKDADAMLAGVPDIEVFLPSKTIAGYRSKLYERNNPTWVKLSVAFREKWISLLSGSKLAVFLVIALHIDENGKSFPSIELISKETGYSERQVIRAIQQLEKQGLLEVTRVYLGNKVSRNFYAVKAFVSYGHTNPISYQSDKMSLAEAHQSDISNINVMSQMSPQVEPVNLSRTINNTQDKLQNQPIPSALENNEMRTKEEIMKGTEEALARNLSGTTSDYAHYPERVRPVVERVHELWNLDVPSRKSKQYGYWITGSEGVLEACGSLGISVLDDLRRDFVLYMESNGGCPPHTVSSPNSLVNSLRSKVALLRGGNNSPMWKTNGKQTQNRLGV